MRRKITAIILAMLMILTLTPMNAFAAAPSVQEVETLIAQIGTVTRENRSAVEKAVNAYNQLDDASKAGVSNFDVLAEAQQILGIKDALAKLEMHQDKVENTKIWFSPYTEKCEETGQSVVALCIGMKENINMPMLMMSMEYIGDKDLRMNEIKIRAGDNKFTYNSGAFEKIERGNIKINNIEKYAERGTTWVEEFDIKMLKEFLSADEVIVRFQRENYGTTEYIDHTVTPEERQAITDVLNAYNLMCSVSPEVLHKALA